MYRAALVMLFSLLLNVTAHATPIRYLLTESDPGGLDNAFLREFADLSALKSLTQTGASNLAANSTPTSSINGLTWAGDRFLMLVEADPGMDGIFLKEFATLTDMQTANPSVVTFLGINIGGSGVSIGGMTWDGNKYYIATESDPGGLGNVFLREFDTLDDLRSLNQSQATLIGTDIGGTGVSVTGLDFDGIDWYLMTESDPGGLGNVFLREFDTLDDLRTLNQSQATLLGTDIGGTGVSTRALMNFTEPEIPPTKVHSPSSLSLFTFGLLALRRSWRRKETQF